MFFLRADFGKCEQLHKNARLEELKSLSAIFLPRTVGHGVSKPIKDTTLSPWEWLKEFLQSLWNCFPGKGEGAARRAKLVCLAQYVLNASDGLNGLMSDGWGYSVIFLDSKKDSFERCLFRRRYFYYGV